MAVWVGTQLVNEGHVPTSQSQQLALYTQFLLPLGPLWRYTDSDDDIITIANQSDLLEACREQRSPGTVLNLHVVHHEPAPSLALSARRKIFTDATSSTPLRRQHSYHQAQGAPVEAHVVEQIRRDMPRTWIVRYLPRGPADPLLIRAENVLNAFAGQFPQIGYCQGMNSVAVALLLLVQSGESSHTPRHSALHTLPPAACVPSSPRDLAVPPTAATVESTVSCAGNSDEADALALLCHWADKILPPAFWANTGELHLDSLAAVQSAGAVVERILTHRQPDLAEAIQAAMPLSVFACRLLPPLFVGLLPLETALALWDAVLEHGAPFLMLAAAALVELALLPVLVAGDTLGPDTIFTKMELFGQTCYDVQELVQLGCEQQPTVEMVGQWMTEAMIEQMEHADPTESWMNAFPEAQQPPEDDDDGWQQVGKEDVSIAGAVEHGFAELGHVAFNTATTVASVGSAVVGWAHLRHKMFKSSSSGDCEAIAECISAADDPLMLVNSCAKISWRGLAVTPLIAAAKHGHAQAVSLLLDSKADPSAQDFWRLTALDYADTYSKAHPAEPRCTEMLKCAMEGNAGSRRSSENLVGAAAEGQLGQVAGGEELLNAEGAPMNEIPTDEHAAVSGVAGSLGVTDLEGLINHCFLRLEAAENYKNTGALVSAIGCYSEALNGLAAVIPLQEQRAREQAAAEGWNAVPDLRAAELLRAKQTEYMQVQQALIQQVAGAGYEQCQPIMPYHYI